MLKNYSEFAKGKLIDPKNLQKKVLDLKQTKTIATLNGSFDLLHAGHLHMIYQASLQADVLIVALNSDESIKQYKSVDRPIISLENRMLMMAALSFVDYVTYFNETDPKALLELIQPDVHVNGAEYGEDCLEAEVIKKYGGKVHIVNLIAGLSTSNIIEKIKTVCV